jgi:hypothetical protein
VKRFFEDALRPGGDGLADYWHDASLGKVDVSGSRVFDWRNVAMKTSDAGGSDKTTPPGPGRQGLIKAAIEAVQRDGLDPIADFHSQLSVYLRNVSGKPPGWVGDPPPDVGSGTPGWSHLWIDGGAWGIQVNLTPPFSGSVTAHEMGHGFGMQHDADSRGITDYPDPCCIMSQNGSSLSPRWGRPFGPALCLPHRMLKGWMYMHRVLVDGGAWAADPRGIEFQLAPISEPSAPAHLGASLAVPGSQPGWEYILEYVDATYWNKAVAGMPYVLIRRLFPSDVTGSARNASYLGAAHIDPSGATTTLLEPLGKTSFTVSRAPGRRSMANVRVRKLTA